MQQQEKQQQMKSFVIDDEEDDTSKIQIQVQNANMFTAVEKAEINIMVDADSKPRTASSGNVASQVLKAAVIKELGHNNKTHARFFSRRYNQVGQSMSPSNSKSVQNKKKKQIMSLKSEIQRLKQRERIQMISKNMKFDP